MNQSQKKEGTKKRRHVEVVVFDEPRKRPRRIRQPLNLVPKQGSIRKENDQSEYDFKAIFDEVKNLGVTGFSKKEKKKLEEQRLQSLGARRPKNQKVPYPILQKIAKKKQERDEKRYEMEKAMGIVTKKKKESKSSKNKTSYGWWTDKPINIDNASNNFKLKKSDLAAIKRKIKH